MQEPKFLNSLHKGRHPQGITVRVVRKWIHYETTGQGAPLFVGMVLADAKGATMYAEVSDDLIDDKAYLFNAGKVYIVKKFIVSNAKRSYRSVDRVLMIEITEYTTVEVVARPPPSIPEYVYKITPFPAIKLAKFVQNYTDVVGYLVKYDEAHTFVPKNTEKAKTLREIYLKDLSDKVMKITLWGDHANNFSIHNIYDSEAGNLIVCLVVGCIPREEFREKGKVCLAGSPACCYYFNPNIPEACDFHSRFKNTPVYIDQPAPTEQAIITVAQDIQLAEKTILDLNHIDPFDDKEHGPFKCAVTVVSITNTNSWWYMACKPCKKKAEQQFDGTYKCPKCDGTDTAPRYLLSFIGKDETDEARFFAYDDEAQKIIQKDCEAVVDPLHMKDGLPQAIQDIINKRYIFSVDLTSDSCKRADKRQYQVKAVLEKPSRRAPGHSTGLSQSQPAQAGSSGTTIVSLQRHSELLQIEASPLNTPSPAVEPQDSASKDSDNRSPPRETSARRKLFNRAGPADKTIEQDDSQEDNDALNRTLAETVSSLQPKNKRPKSLPQEQGKEDGDRS